MWVPFVFALSVLGYVSVLDFKTRRVSNWIWLFAYPIGCAMTLVSVAFNLVELSVVLVSLVVSLFLGLGLCCSGFYGSADAKALIFIGLTIPTIPHALNPALGLSALPVVLTTFCLSAILSLIWPLFIFSLNLKDLLKRKTMFEGIQLTLRQKIWLLFTSRLIPLDKLGVLRYFPAETVAIPKEAGGKPARKLLRFVKAETNLKKYIDNLKEHSELYQNGVLASPTIPAMIFFTLALVIVPLCT
ncbi:MAG: prepilin peptidase [Nitrososphaerota archaeon]|jgi:Flp pilus assembly protein protease CpaA|nr:prepilin peptidase [Nitrososphaerota archaeon]